MEVERVKIAASGKKDMKSRRILIISHSYKPATTPRAIRWSAIAEYWAAQGHKVDLICAWEPGWDNYEVLQGVKVHRVEGRIIEAGRSKIKKLLAGGGGPQDQIAVSAVGRNRGLMPHFSFAVKWFYDHTWKKIYWPDHACLWYWPAIRRAMKLLDDHVYDNLISVSFPFIGHLVGLSCKRRFPQIKWVVDVGDPFCFAEITTPNNIYLYNKLNYYIEHKVFNNASAISVTNQLTADKYCELFQDNAQKISVIPPLMPAVEAGGIKNYHNNNQIRMVFMGTLYRGIRNPSFLLNLFVKLLQTRLSEKLEIHFLGKLDGCEDYFQKYRHLLSNKIFLHGQVDRATALKAMQEADILVNIGNDNPFQLPSKVFEYIGNGKPILNIARVEPDSSHDILRNYPVSLTLWDRDADLTPEQLANCLEFIEHPPKIDLASLRPWLKNFELETIAKSYEDLLEN